MPLKNLHNKESALEDLFALDDINSQIGYCINTDLMTMMVGVVVIFGLQPCCDIVMVMAI